MKKVIVASCCCTNAPETESGNPIFRAEKSQTTVTVVVHSTSRFVCSQLLYDPQIMNLYTNATCLYFLLPVTIVMSGSLLSVTTAKARKISLQYFHLETAMYWFRINKHVFISVYHKTYVNSITGTNFIQIYMVYLK